eukprot:2795704-Rhodomonas_salina.1
MMGACKTALQNLQNLPSDTRRVPPPGVVVASTMVCRPSDCCLGNSKSLWQVQEEVTATAVAE